MEESLTLAELAATASAQLAGEGVEPGNGQVSAQVDQRTLRYYTTLGLLDRPSARRGRTALYSRRHLAQAVAVKRLQAAGWPLADIQRRLVGLSTTELGAVSASQSPPPPTTAAVPDRDDFWAHPPLLTAATAAAAVPLAGVALPGGAVLLLPQRPTGSAPTQEDVRALAHAAAPLLAEAARRGLLGRADWITSNEDEGEDR